MLQKMMLLIEIGTVAYLLYLLVLLRGLIASMGGVR